MKSTRAYVAATAVVFAFLIVAHVLRISEGPGTLGNPWFVVTTLIATAFVLWAFAFFGGDSERRTR